MEKPRAREAAIEAVTSWPIEGRRAPKLSTPIRQLFGANVFSDEVMRSRLPENVYKAFATRSRRAHRSTHQSPTSSRRR